MTHLYRTQTTGNRRTFTVSTWIKFGGSYGSSGAIILNTDGSNTNQNFMYQLKTDNTISLHLYGGDVFTTSRKLRDYSGWYHIVLGIDTTQASAGNRVKLYVNGELQSITQESLYPAQNFDFGVGDNGRVMSIMGDHDNSNNYDNRSYISHYHFCDGYQYQASDFGETDSTTGEWKIKTSPSVNYGSTGFFLKFENSSNLVEDSGGNSISFSTSGTPIASQDNPSNNFATLNPLASLPNTGASTFTNGNTTSQGTNSSYVNGGSTLMMSSGKFYAEMKYVATSNASRCWVGITEDVSEISRINQDVGSYNVVYRSQTGGLNIEGGGENSYGATFTTGDIIGIALDLDNNRLFFSKNGTWQNSGDPTSSTGAITTFTAPASTLNGGWFFASGSDSNAQNNTVSWNFGNGYFGTTQISSAGTNASNLGIFEYDVPNGYTALCTKGLNL